MLFRSCAFVLLLLTGLAAQTANTDGLTILGSGKTYVDAQGDRLTLKSSYTKYKEPVVGFWFEDAAGQKIRFYANPKVWDQLKQVLVRARDNWETLSARTLDQVGEVQGYRIGNQQARLRVNLQGETSLQSKELILSVSGGPDHPRRILIHLHRDDLKNLVEEFHTVDDFYRKASDLKP